MNMNYNLPPAKPKYQKPRPDTDWIYETTKEEKKKFLKENPNKINEYIEMVNALDIDTYIEYLHIIKNETFILDIGKKGELYIPENEKAFEIFTVNITTNILYALILHQDIIGFQAKPFNYLKLLKNFGGLRVILSNTNTRTDKYFHNLFVLMFESIFDKYKEIEIEKSITINDIFETPQEYFYNLSYCEQLFKSVEKHYGLRLLNLYKVFGVLTDDFGFDVIENLTSCFSPTYNSFHAFESYALFPNDNEIINTYIEKGKDLLENKKIELIQNLRKYEGCSGKGLIVNSINPEFENQGDVTIIKGFQINYQGDGSFYDKTDKAGTFIDINTATGINDKESLLQTIIENKIKYQNNHYLEKHINNHYLKKHINKHYAR